MSYSQEERDQLRAMFVASGVKRDRADQIVDLACHAAESVVDALKEVVKRAPDSGIGLMTLELAAQLARARMEAMFQRTHAYGQSVGVPQYRAEVELRS